MADELKLDVFFGDASVAETRVYARLLGPGAADCRVSGSFRGPYCRYGHTLPATLPLHDAGPGVTRLLRGVVPDPCFWSPEQPHRYRVQVQVERPGRPVEEHERWLGIRPLGPRGNRLSWESKTWVPRLVDERLVPAAALADWREAGAVVIAAEWNDDRAREASEIGVALAVRLSPDASAWIDQARRLASWPAVVLGWIDGDAPGLSQAMMQELRRTAPNLLWGIEIELRGRPPSSLGADLWIARQATHPAEAKTDRLPSSDWIEASQPVIMAAPLSGAEGLGAARAACDALQARLAPGGQWAGYAILAATSVQARPAAPG